MANAKARGRGGIALRFVVYREGKWWIAHCLELDLVAEGRTASAALSDLADIASTQMTAAKEAGDFASIFRPAPPEIWAMFVAAHHRPAPRKKPLQPVERFEVREAALV
jgi:hypothetical protein